MDQSPFKVRRARTNTRKYPVRLISMDSNSENWSSISGTSPGKMLHNYKEQVQSLLDNLSKKIHMINEKWSNLKSSKKRISADAFIDFGEDSTASLKLLSANKMSDKISLRLSEIRKLKETALDEYKEVQKEWEKLELMNQRLVESKSLVSKSNAQLTECYERLQAPGVQEVSDQTSQLNAKVQALITRLEDKKRQMNKVESEANSQQNNVDRKTSQLQKLTQDRLEKEEMLRKKNQELEQMDSMLDTKYKNICEELVNVEAHLLEMYKASDQIEEIMKNRQ